MKPDVVQTLERAGSILRLQVSAKCAKFFVVTEDDFVMTFAVMDAGRLFTGLRCESKADNEIFLETNIALVSRALSSGSSATYVSLKLIQRAGQAFLEFEVQDATSGVVVIQDVPVTVLPAADAGLFEEPRITSPEVRLVVRDTRSLRHVSDRMKALARFVELEANMAGDLAISIATEAVSMKTYYRGLVPQGAGGDATARSVVKVDAKRLSKVLAACHTLPGSLIACE